MTEAHALGVVGRGAIASAARKMLAGDPADDVIAAMEKVLPAPIDHFLLQADLTVIVPGPLERDLAEQLASVATVESAGAAMVYRISEASIRRALDTGRTAGELHALFDRHSKTPVPQGLTYLIDDVARRHGQLRVGMAQSFVRCEDAALLAQAVAAPAAEQLEMRLLAPTVAVSQAPISEVLAALRDAGFAPAAEDSTGAIVDIRARGARVPAPPRRRAPRLAPTPTSQTLGAIVAVLRKVASAPFGNMRLDPAVAISQLQEAAHLQSSVVIGYVDPAGVATQRVVAPINVRGGQLTAYDPASGRVREFAIHRVTSVVSADCRIADRFQPQAQRVHRTVGEYVCVTTVLSAAAQAPAGYRARPVACCTGGCRRRYGPWPRWCWWWRSVGGRDAGGWCGCRWRSSSA